MLVWMAGDQGRTSRAQLRAWVFVREFTPIVRPSGTIDCVLIWENAGSTPTKDLRNWVNWGWFDKDIGDDFDYPDLGEDRFTSQSVVWPHGTMHTIGFTLTPSQIAELEDTDNRFFYVWGWAEYNDVFPGTKRHRTEFCTRVLASSDGAQTMVEFRHHSAHNSGT